MPLIDYTYFVGPLNIPGTDKVHVQERVEYFIEKHEAELLQCLLGYSLYKAFKAEPTAQRFLDLVQGREYTDVAGRTQHWDGLTTEGDITLLSPIACYVYFHYMRHEATQTTGVGEAVPNTDNATRVAPTGKLVSAWNDLSRSICVLMDYLEANAATYPEWDLSCKYQVLRDFRRINVFGL